MAFSVFMLLIAENIPATSEMIPLIGIYLTVTMSLTSLSIILTVVVLNLHHHGEYAPPVLSEKLYLFMTRQIAHKIGMKSTVERYEMNRFNVEKKHLKDSKINNSKCKSNNNNISIVQSKCDYHQLNQNHINNVKEKMIVKNCEESKMCSCCICFKTGLLN